MSDPSTPTDLELLLDHIGPTSPNEALLFAEIERLRRDVERLERLLLEAEDEASL
jgi:hypothetical protein